MTIKWPKEYLRSFYNYIDVCDDTWHYRHIVSVTKKWRKIKSVILQLYTCFRHTCHTRYARWKLLSFYNIVKHTRATFTCKWAPHSVFSENLGSSKMCWIFTFSSHTKYVKRESIAIAWVKKKFSLFENFSWFVCLRRQKKPKKFPSACLSVWMSGCTYVRGLFMWTQ